ncbi:50S ribosomal protein L4 [Candidatus Nomurabacteria bacterium]|nr:50S ribosomal protein L4 [Candidatus Nomurabacteria bacterium]
MKTAVYDKTGKEVKQIELPSEIFGIAWDDDFIHQVVTSMESNKRNAIAKVKDRSEVSGTGKKPWRQKGTGRARHGSKRSPIWVGGGVAHGPTNERNFDRKVNRKMKVKAVNTILSQKAKDGELILIDSLEFEVPKTAEAKEIIKAISKNKGLETLATKRKNAAFVAVDENDLKTKKSFANFSNIKLDEVRNLNPVDILNYKFIIIENPEKSFEILKSRIK